MNRPLPSFSLSRLYPYQLEMLNRVKEAWEESVNVMVQMPTGTGKTHLLAAVVSEILSTKEQEVWIIAHRRELVEQIEETVAGYGIPPGERIRVFSIQWLSRHWEELGKAPGLIVIDEAHHALAESYRALWQRFPRTRKLGMTATPCRLNRRGFTELFDTLLLSREIAAFIRDGYLSPFDYVSIRPGSEEQRLVEGLGKRGADGDFQIKEMDEALNRVPSIERLYKGLSRFAKGRKGIVYAISISHARNIADYYSRHGLEAAAIDSKTPSRERRRLVEAFRAGKLRVLVNVDVFSEGFDCPDVEFVQMARPTLSLAKYLQQVGRGLRKSAGKRGCVLIDHVGLYRLFGLPTQSRDWQAMFEGRLAGKGHWGANAYCATDRSVEEYGVRDDADLELIVSGDSLMALLGKQGEEAVDRPEEPLRAFRDRRSGLWGLRRGEVVTALPQYASVLGLKGHFAAVRLASGETGIVDADGHLRMRLDRRKIVKMLRDNLLSVRLRDQYRFVDLLSGQAYPERPRVRRYGKIEVLEVARGISSRTRRTYHGMIGANNLFLRDYYLEIYDQTLRPKYRTFGYGEGQPARLCLLEGDDADYYQLCGKLPDGSVVIADREGNYYHAGKGSGKRWLLNDKEGSDRFRAIVETLWQGAELKARQAEEENRRARDRERLSRLKKLRRAKPFQSGMKWGLRLDDRIIIPPIYHNMRMPVGDYCAVEVYPCRWGVITLDGKLVIHPKYIHIEIKEDGTALLTLTPGKTEKVRL